MQHLSDVSRRQYRAERAAGEPELIAEARGWIADCVWAELEPEDIAELAPFAIALGVDRHYDGGLEQFRRDCEPWPIVQGARRYPWELER